MERTYAIVRLCRLTEEEGDLQTPLYANFKDVKPIKGISQGLATPIRFDDAPETWWTAMIFLKEPVHPGETVIVPMEMLKLEAEDLLRAGAEFQVKLGSQTVARGQVNSIECKDEKQ